MATLGHVAIGLAAGRLHSPKHSAAAMGAFTALSLLPDADAVAFALGIPYSAPFGHRGAAHSLALAAAVGLVAGAGCLLLRRPPVRTALLAFGAVASHGLLDALTDGGLGIALLWPATNARCLTRRRWSCSMWGRPQTPECLRLRLVGGESPIQTGFLQIREDHVQRMQHSLDGRFVCSEQRLGCVHRVDRIPIVLGDADEVLESRGA